MFEEKKYREITELDGIKIGPACSFQSNSKYKNDCVVLKIFPDGNNITSADEPYYVEMYYGSLTYFSRKHFNNSNLSQYPINKPIQFKLKDPEAWFLNLLNQMEQKTIPEYTNIIFFHIDGVLYMEYNINSHVLWYSYSKIQSILRSKFNLNGEQIKELVKNTVEEHTNLWDLHLSNLIFKSIYYKTTNLWHLH